MRGPLVYCLESTDLPEGVRPGDVMLARTIPFKPVRADALEGPLVGLTALEGRAFIRGRSKPWTGALYHEVAQDSIIEVPIQLIPYYAWDNRGKSEMTVWINLVT